MSQEPLYTEIYRKNAAAQNHGAHFARACAVKMHFNMSREPLHTKIYGNNAAAQNHGANFVRACAVETHVKISQEPLYAEIHRKVQQPKTTAHTLCEPARSKRMPRFLYAEIYRKMLQPRLSPERRHTQSEHPDQALTFTLTVRTPQCRHTVWRKMHVFQIHNMLKILWRARLWP